MSSARVVGFSRIAILVKEYCQRLSTIVGFLLCQLGIAVIEAILSFVNFSDLIYAPTWGA